MGLRQAVLRGGAYLIFRQGLGLIISFGGVILLTRLLGPTDYGLYAGAFGVLTFLNRVGPLGVNVYLIRREQAPTAAMYNQAFTLLLLCGVSVAAILFLLSPLLRSWFSDPGFIPPLRALLLALPLSLLPFLALARLERDLNYGAVASVELSGQLAFQVVALSLAFSGWGVWAPVTGYWVWQFCLVVVGYTLARFRPRLVWSRELLKEMLGYGLGYSASQWLWELRHLVNPLVVGRFLGPEGVGYVYLATRLAEALVFVQAVTWRLSIAALAKVQGEYARLRRAMEEAMGLQVLAVAPLLAGFAAVAPWLVPVVFGQTWEPVLVVYPFIAFAYLINAVFNMHASVLYVLRRNLDVALFHGVYVLLFAGGALLLVPRLGLLGFGLGQVIAAASHLVLHARVYRLFSFSYARALPWLLGFAPPLFAVFLPFPQWLALWLPIGMVAMLPKQRQQIAGYLGDLRLVAARSRPH